MTSEAPAKRVLIITPEFRLSFNCIFKAVPNMNGITRYEMEMLFPKSAGASQFTEMKRIYDSALLTAKFSGAGPTPRPFKDAVTDGDLKKQPGRKGMWFVKANASAEINGRPNRINILLPNKRPALEADVYEGCWCRSILSAYPYEARKDGKSNAPVISRGASFSIHTVQKLRDDKPFSSRISDAELEAMLDAVEPDDEFDLLS